MTAKSNLETRARQQLLTSDEVTHRLRLDVGRTPQAQRKAMVRVWSSAQDARIDRKQPPLKRIRLGSRWYYEPSVVDAIVDALSVEF